MLTKLATFRGVSAEGEPLVRLFEPSMKWDFVKTAGPIMPQIKQWLAGYTPDPQKIAVLVNAMGASEYWGQNVNGDIFPEKGLIHDCRNHNGQSHPYDDFTGKIIPPYGYWTFLHAHPFVHHKNKDPARAFGHVELACWNPKMHRVELVVILDKAAALEHGGQHVIDRILAGEYPDVSMGCRVPYDICTICGNKSKTRNDYCACVKQIGMGKILDDGRRIGVINTYPRFFDISFVFIGADKTAKVMCKLGSGLVVPQSVADAEDLYGPEIDSPTSGLMKAAEPRIAGVTLAESDRILSRKDPEAPTPPPRSDPEEARFPRSDKNAWEEWLEAAKEEEMGRDIGEPQKKEARKERAKEKAASVMMSSVSDYRSEDGKPVSDFTIKNIVSDGKRVTVVEKRVPEPPEQGVLYGKADDQEDKHSPAVADGTLKTNARTQDDDDPTKMASRRGAITDFYLLRAQGENPTPPGGVDRRAEVVDYYTKQASGLSRVFERAKHITIGKPPSPNRKEYPFVGTINFRGIIVHVENKPGSVREGTGWRTNMKLPYGEIQGTLGIDGDKLDVYVGPKRDCENVYIVHQNFVRGPNEGKYDEDKVMLGFDNFMEAKEAYLAHYDSPKFFRSMTVMAFPLFKKALKKKEVHGEKVAAAYQNVVADMRLEDEFGVKKAGLAFLFNTWDEAAAKARELNAEIPYDWIDVLGLVPKKDEASGKYSLTYRRLSAQRMKEVFGQKTAMEKTAVRADLDHLFSNSKNARRRERTWRDKVTGKEHNEEGSGLAEKTAALDLSTARPEVLKIAMVLRQGWSASDLLKVSNEMKAASHLKWAEIVKRIGPSKAVGRVTPLLSQSEETLPREVLNELGEQKDLAKSLATPSLMGMVLKPEEFQRIALTHMGKGPLADKLDDANAVFKPSDEESCPCSELKPDHMDGDLMKTLLPFLEGKSYAGPIVRRRIIRIVKIEPKEETPPTEVDSPLLSKVAAAYTWYRREQMKLASELPAAIVSHPELHAGVYQLEPENVFAKNAAAAETVPLSNRSLALILGAIPLTLMYSAHKKGAMERGEDVGFLGRMVGKHPWLATMGVVTGLGAALRNPRASQATDEAFEALDRVWKGKQAPAAKAAS